MPFRPTLAPWSSPEHMVTRILGRDPGTPQHLDSTVCALAEAAARPDLVSVKEIDVPCRQRCLSQCIDEESDQRLLDSASDIRFRALALSSALPHAGDWFNIIPFTALGLHF